MILVYFSIVDSEGVGSDLALCVCLLCAWGIFLLNRWWLSGLA